MLYHVIWITEIGLDAQFVVIADSEQEAISRVKASEFIRANTVDDEPLLFDVSHLGFDSNGVTML